MIKLYYATNTCSTACHIAIEESGLPYTPVEVSWKRNLNVAEHKSFNPLGAVPTLISEQGKVLTQNAAILEYIADLKPASKLLAAQGSWERYETLKWVAFVSSDLHKSFTPFFRLKDMTASESAQLEIKNFATKNIHGYLKYVDTNLAEKNYITGSQFTIADAYLFVIAGWTKYVEIPTDEYKNLTAYMSRVAQRPAVQKVLKAEA